MHTKQSEFYNFSLVQSIWVSSKIIYYPAKPLSIKDEMKQSYQLCVKIQSWIPIIQQIEQESKHGNLKCALHVMKHIIIICTLVH